MNEPIQCQTTYYGVPCDRHAGWFVRGGRVKAHLCCGTHMLQWHAWGLRSHARLEIVRLYPDAARGKLEPLP